MIGKEFDKQWTRQDTLKSGLLFFVHYLIFMLIAAILLFGGKVENLGDVLKTQRANYLYAIFCIAMLFLITYCYYFFESREMISSVRNINLIFSVLDLYLILIKILL